MTVKEMLKTATLIFVVFASFCAAANQVTRARVYLYKAVKGGIPQTNVGVIDFIQNGNSLSLNGTISASLGLTPGLHGFHIHEKGDLGNGCMDTGAHYNPHMMTHGAPTDSNRHVGDLGNINAPANGDLQIRVSDTLASLTGQFSIIGRGVVVHEKPDDLGRGGSDLSKTTGDAGARLACGVIGILQEEFVTTTVPIAFDDPDSNPSPFTASIHRFFLLICFIFWVFS